MRKGQVLVWNPSARDASFLSIEHEHAIAHIACKNTLVGCAVQAAAEDVGLLIFDTRHAKPLYSTCFSSQSCQTVFGWQYFLIFHFTLFNSFSSFYSF